jgi:hypothetical protein
LPRPLPVASTARAGGRGASDDTALIWHSTCRSRGMDSKTTRSYPGLAMARHFSLAHELRSAL